MIQINIKGECLCSQGTDLQGCWKRTEFRPLRSWSRCYCWFSFFLYALLCRWYPAVPVTLSWWPRGFSTSLSSSLWRIQVDELVEGNETVISHVSTTTSSAYHSQTIIIRLDGTGVGWFSHPKHPGVHPPICCTHFIQFGVMGGWSPSQVMHVLGDGRKPTHPGGEQANSTAELLTTVLTTIMMDYPQLSAERAHRAMISASESLHEEKKDPPKNFNQVSNKPRTK